MRLIKKRKSVLDVQQVNPLIHAESQVEVNRVREEIQTAAESISTEDAAVEARLRRRGNNNRNINCPICLANAHFPIETNCGHIFCGTTWEFLGLERETRINQFYGLIFAAPCIMQYWQHLTSNLSKMKCPMCRQDVSCLLPLYSRREAARHESESDDLARVFQSIKSYNRRFSGAPRNVKTPVYFTTNTKCNN